jgi:sec-independent protein translocase protein TatA
MVTGWEWILIIVVLMALIIWGPKKIPELARALGEARGEFERASKEVSKMPKKKKEEASGDDALIETARKLGIDTEGKTRDQISEEILRKFKGEKTDSS